MSILQLRLKHCLQTILDLEEDIDNSALSSTFASELELIRSFVDELKNVAVNEEEVFRVEKATNNFLNELNELLQSKPTIKTSFGRWMQ